VVSLWQTNDKVKSTHIAHVLCCAEPVITEGSTDIRVLNDGWTAISLDDSRSAQFEHTILITKHGVEIMTLGC